MRYAILIGLTLFTFGCFAKPTPPTVPVGHTTQMEPYPIPAFSLTERSDKTVTKDDLVGKVWIAAFVFTRCNGPCPNISATMAKLQLELLPTRDDVRLVTFTVDPIRDTPDVLKRYAVNFRADPEKWLFLTGKEAEVRSLLMDGFKINATKNVNPKPGDEFDHNTKLLVVDKKGNVCGMFDGMKREWDTDGSVFAEDLQRLTKLVDSLR